KNFRQIPIDEPGRLKHKLQTQVLMLRYQFSISFPCLKKVAENKPLWGFPNCLTMKPRLFRWSEQYNECFLPRVVIIRWLCLLIYLNRERKLPVKQQNEYSASLHYW